MKADLTDITFILDRSASMKPIARETEEGIQHVIEEQRKLPGECVVSLILFDDQIEKPFTATPLIEVPQIVCEPRGNTALLDAIWTGIKGTGHRLLNTPERARPGSVILVISTDGEENASGHRMDEIAPMIAHQRDVYKWQFMFLGANQDAIANASKLNIPQGAAINYAHNAGGTKAVYGVVSRAITSNRTGSGLIGADIGFSEQERLQALDRDN